MINLTKTFYLKMETGLFFDLLASINEDLPDEMMILELMDDKQPIQALVEISSF